MIYESMVDRLILIKLKKKSLIHRAIDFLLSSYSFYMCSKCTHTVFKELLGELRSLEKDLLWYSQRTRRLWLPPCQTNWQSTWGIRLHNARLNIIKCASNFRFFLRTTYPFSKTHKYPMKWSLQIYWKSYVTGKEYTWEKWNTNWSGGFFFSFGWAIE